MDRVPPSPSSHASDTRSTIPPRRPERCGVLKVREVGATLQMITMDHMLLGAKGVGADAMKPSGGPRSNTAPKQEAILH
jgi:hypothetical protein